MSLKEKFPAFAVTAVLAVGMYVLVSNVISGPESRILVKVKVPELSSAAKVGEVAFAENCTSCHGQNASGSDKGPPLVHNIYNPGHHADGAFVLATKQGVRRHHWRFGNMPPQPKVSDRDIADIIRYVRELQAANGITYKPHNM